jgi:hypothetical protein
VTTDRPLVLVEPYTHRPGGHWHRTLNAVAAAAVVSGRIACVIAPNGVTANTAVNLQAAGAVVVDGHGFRGEAALLLSAAGGVTAVSAALGQLPGRHHLPLPVRRLPHQLTLVARCLAEAASLRTARQIPARYTPVPGRSWS